MLPTDINATSHFEIPSKLELPLKPKSPPKTKSPSQTNSPAKATVPSQPDGPDYAVLKGMLEMRDRQVLRLQADLEEKDKEVDELRMRARDTSVNLQRQLVSSQRQSDLINLDSQQKTVELEQLKELLRQNSEQIEKQKLREAEAQKLWELEKQAEREKLIKMKQEMGFWRSLRAALVFLLVSCASAAQFQLLCFLRIVM